MCETASLITSSSASGVKYIGLNVLVSYLVNMEAKEKLSVEYLEIDSTLLKNYRKLSKDSLDLYICMKIFRVSYCLFELTKIPSKNFKYLLVTMLPHHPSCIQPVNFNLVF